MAEENRHRYRTAIAKMLTQGQYQDSWSGGYKSVTEKYGRMVDSYVSYKQELSKAGQGDKYDKEYYVKQSEHYMKEIQGYFKELKQGLQTVVSKKDVRSIETGRVMAWVK